MANKAMKICIKKQLALKILYREVVTARGDYNSKTQALIKVQYVAKCRLKKKTLISENNYQTVQLIQFISNQFYTI